MCTNRAHKEQFIFSVFVDIRFFLQTDHHFYNSWQLQYLDISMPTFFRFHQTVCKYLLFLPQHMTQESRIWQTWLLLWMLQWISLWLAKGLPLVSIFRDLTLILTARICYVGYTGVCNQNGCILFPSLWSFWNTSTMIRLESLMLFLYNTSSVCGNQLTRHR